MERAYLLRGGPDVDGATRCEVDARVCLRDERSPSRNLSRRMVLGGGPLRVRDATTDRRFRGEHSVRRLALRGILGAAAPPGPDGTVIALLLDSREMHEGDSHDSDLVAGLAAMAALIMRGLAVRADATRPSGGVFVRRSLIGRSAPFVEMMRWVERMRPYDYPLLVLGESGSGKECVARAIHEGRTGPFVALNCAAVPPALQEAELFGSVRGAFTGADRDRPGLFRRARAGTLLLDEVGDMPAGLQAKLLRVLQEGAVRPVGSDDEIDVDVRIVAATHRDLVEEVRLGRFRADLFHRLSALEVRVPPLRERGGDIMLLANAFLEEICRKQGLPAARFTVGAREALLAHPWPGNVRELRWVVLRSLVRSSGVEIRSRHLGLVDIPTSDPPRGGAGFSERDMIRRALEIDRNVVSRAAERIGWSRQKLYRRMAALGIRR